MQPCVSHEASWEGPREQHVCAGASSRSSCREPSTSHARQLLWTAASSNSLLAVLGMNAAGRHPRIRASRTHWGSLLPTQSQPTTQHSGAGPGGSFIAGSYPDVTTAAAWRVGGQWGTPMRCALPQMQWMQPVEYMHCPDLLGAQPAVWQGTHRQCQDAAAAVTSAAVAACSSSAHCPQNCHCLPPQLPLPLPAPHAAASACRGRCRCTCCCCAAAAAGARVP